MMVSFNLRMGLVSVFSGVFAVLGSALGAGLMAVVFFAAGLLATIFFAAFFTTFFGAAFFRATFFGAALIAALGVATSAGLAWAGATALFAITPSLADASA